MEKWSSLFWSRYLIFNNMSIFGKYSGGLGGDFNVAGNMDAVMKGQQNIHDNMMAAVEKFNTARQDMEVLQKQTGSILSQYGVDEKGKPDDKAPKYVHDLFKAVNKEGGIANMSRSQMIAGLKAYETGVGVAKTDLEMKTNEENLRGKKLQDDILEMQYNEAVRVREDNKRIRDAKAATEEARKALKTTKTGETINEILVPYEGENIKLDSKEFKPLIDTRDAAKTPEEIEAAERAIEKYLYSKSKMSRRKDIVGSGVSTEEYDEKTGEWIYKEGTVEKDNPFFKEFKSAYDKADMKELNLTAGERRTPATFSKGQVSGFISRELAKLKAIRDQTEEKKTLDIDVTKYEAGKDEGASGWLWSRPPTIVNTEQRLNREAKSKNETFLQILEEEIQTGVEDFGGEAGYKKLSQKEILERRKRVLELKKENKVLDEKFAKAQEVLDKKVKDAEAPVPEYSAGEFRSFEGGEYRDWRKVQTEVRKSVEEQLDDQYGIMVNYFKSHGGVPESFTKDAFFKMSGVNNPVNVDVGGGYQYVAFGGKEAIVKRVEANGMSTRDQKTMWEAGEFSKARNLNGLSVNGYRFTGEVRVGDIDKANTVKNELFTTTRALSAVDRMIEIAEDASLFDKLAPTQISGIATALTNAAQSANRTEIGGSGAWSNQDQAYMDKVITNPAGAFNAIFSSQTVAVLKEYRQRLLMGMHDKATVYGFAFERDGVSSDNQMSQFRVLYNSALHRGMSEQEALEYSKGQLYANAQ
jgi:hypothetical protein